ncbi:hypothetical protein [Haloarchaeobius iranensis]|uniref:Uncharacterized protein n=1 Tax=Haloarchaeobius iranensis TaxID=996166 RepID=A0A1G9VVE4_9EURY|nr:hypothetical protein [Haloarchaeobius iranensis]SDM75956.1 hypothetical protein SAMN05192554_10714 [Haloarchaeobius iranensis]
MREPSRREILSSVGAVGATAALAGCLDVSFGGTADAPPANEFRRWLPAPSALRNDAVTLYDADVAAVGEHRDAMVPSTFGNLVETVLTGPFAQYLGTQHLQEVVQLVQERVVLVRTDRSDAALAEALTDAGLSEVATYGDVPLYSRRDEPAMTTRMDSPETDDPDSSTATRSTDDTSPATGTSSEEWPETVAVVDGVLVQGAGEPGRDTVETVLDARRGEADRLLETSEAHATLYDRTDGSNVRAVGPPVVGAERNFLPGITGLAFTWAVGPSTTEFAAVSTFREGEAPPAEGFESFVQSKLPADRYEAFEPTADGHVRTVTATVPTDRFAPFSSGAPEDSKTAPVIEFEFDYDVEAGTVTIANGGGDSVAAARLHVNVAGSRAETQFADEHETFAAGDAITVDISGVESGSEVQVVWTSADGDAAQIVAESSVPRSTVDDD